MYPVLLRPVQTLERELLGHAEQFLEQENFVLAPLNAATAAEVLIYAELQEHLTKRQGVRPEDAPRVLQQQFGNRVVPDALLAAPTDLSEHIRSVFALRARLLRGGLHDAPTKPEVEQAITLVRILLDRDE
jgi:hypothetical protein